MNQAVDPANTFLMYAAITTITYIVYRIILKCVSKYGWDSSDDFLLLVLSVCWPLTVPLGLAFLLFKGIGLGVDVLIEVVTDEVEHRKRQKRKGNHDNL